MALRISEIEYIKTHSFRILSLISITYDPHLSCLKTYDFRFQKLSLVTEKLHYSPYRTVSGAKLQGDLVLINNTEKVLERRIDPGIIIRNLHETARSLCSDFPSSGICKAYFRDNIIQAGLHFREIYFSLLPSYSRCLKKLFTVSFHMIAQWQPRIQDASVI